MPDAKPTHETDAMFTLQLGPCGLLIGPGVYVWAGSRDAFLGRPIDRLELIVGRTRWVLDGFRVRRWRLS